MSFYQGVVAGTLTIIAPAYWKLNLCRLDILEDIAAKSSGAQDLHFGVHDLQYIWKYFRTVYSIQTLAAIKMHVYEKDVKVAFGSDQEVIIVFL